MIAALLLMSLAGVTVVAVAGSIRTVLRDGYRRVPTRAGRAELSDPASRELPRSRSAASDDAFAGVETRVASPAPA